MSTRLSDAPALRRRAIALVAEMDRTEERIRIRASRRGLLGKNYRTRLSVRGVLNLEVEGIDTLHKARRVADHAAEIGLLVRSRRGRRYVYAFPSERYE